MKTLTSLIVLLALVGCATRSTEPADTASPFDRFLALEYDMLADAEFAEADWINGLHFARKAEAARRGEAPEPDTLAERELPPRLRQQFEAALDRLNATLAGTARLVDPETLAGAQAAYDCWAQEAEEDRQPDEIAACRDALLAKLIVLEDVEAGAVVVLLPSEAESAITVTKDTAETQLAKPFAGVSASAAAMGETLELDEAETLRVISAALAATPRPERSYLVYFKEGSADLTPESLEVMQAAIADARETVAVRVTVFGHTDRQGPAGLNVRLARKRAEAIRLLMVAEGVLEDLITADSFGESFPLIPTADGVPEPRNRRVEIAVR